MNNFLLQYVAESAVCLLLFYLFYALVLQKETCFQFNRFYLLGALLVAVLLPLVSLPSWPAPEPVVQSIISESTFDYPVTAYDYSVAEAVEVEEPEKPIHFWPWLYMVYAVGMLFFAGRFGYQLVSLYRYAKQEGPYFKLTNQAPVIQTNGKLPTFSFLGYVFFDNTQALSPEETERILQHEKVHIDQKHSLDILLVSLLSVVFWFNPLLQLYKKALEQTHEFIADAEVVRHTDAREYASLLLKQVFQKVGFSMGSYFFFNKSLTLNRIYMMKSSPQSPKIKKVLLMMPLLVGLVAALMAMRPAEAPVYDFTEVDTRVGDAPAEFPGDDNAYKDFWQEKHLLPEILFKKAGGKSHIYMLMEYEFEVGVDGKAKLVKILDLQTQPDDPEAKEAVKKLYLEALKNMPRWKPALKDGKPVAVIKKGGYLRDYYHAELGYQKYLEEERKSRIQSSTKAAEFPGGREAANNFVRNNFTFPKIAFDNLTGREKAVQAVASLEVEIKANGSAVLSNVLEMEVSPSHPQVQEAIKNEFARVVNAMPAWSPALKDGKPVASKEIIKIASVSADFTSYSKYVEHRQQKTKVTSATTEVGADKNVKSGTSKVQNAPLKELTVVGHPSSEGYAEVTPDIQVLSIIFYPPAHLKRSQTKNQNLSENVKKSAATTPDGEKIYIAVEKMPEFNGGKASFYKKLANSIRIPREDQQNGVEGIMTGTFVVSTEGKVTMVEIVKGLSPTLNQELKRVLSSLPDFKPGTQNGRAVPVRYIVPVRIEGKWAEQKEASPLPEKTVEGRPLDTQEQKGNDAQTTDKVFIAVEQMPQFPGGQAAMFKYLSDNFKVPAEDQKSGAEGTLVLSFIVTKTGEITDAQVLKSLSPTLDEEALRVVNSMPLWLPGKQNGKAVNVKYTVPYRIVAKDTPKQ